jgi:hypothetical protein
MNEAGREIAILSLGQILALAEDHIEGKDLEILERHVKQIAAILQGKEWNRPDETTAHLLFNVRQLLTGGSIDN